MSGKQKQIADAARPKKCPKPDERLPIIRRRIEEGKSLRAISRELGCDDKTIARDLRKLALPPEQLAAILEGEWRRNTLMRLCSEKPVSTGAPETSWEGVADKRRLAVSMVDPLARALLGWLSRKRLTNPNLELVLNDAKRMSRVVTG